MPKEGSDDLPPPYTAVDPNAGGTANSSTSSVGNGRPVPPPHPCGQHRLHTQLPSQSSQAHGQKPHSAGQKPQSQSQSHPHPQQSHSHSHVGHYPQQQQQFHGHLHGHPQPHHPQHHPQGLRYPPNFYCQVCRNTGIKPSGFSCKDCWDRFGPRNNHVMAAPHRPMGPARVVQPGDPSIGGILCGRCRGTGVTHELLLFEETCRVCGGIGRIIR